MKLMKIFKKASDNNICFNCSSIYIYKKDNRICCTYCGSAIYHNTKFKELNCIIKINKEYSLRYCNFTYKLVLMRFSDGLFFEVCKLPEHLIENLPIKYEHIEKYLLLK